MGLRDLRRLDSFEPRRRRDEDADRGNTVEVILGTFNKSFTRDIFRGFDWLRVTKVSLVVDAAVGSANESFWSFQIVNLGSNNVSGVVGLNAIPISTAKTAMAADTPYDIVTDLIASNNTPQQIIKGGDVLALQAVKTGGPLQLSNLRVFIEYEVSGITTTTSSSTTTTTTTTTSTSSSTSTTTSTSSTTSSSTSTSSTTTVSTSTSITTTSSSTTITTSSSTSSSTTTTSSSTSTSSSTTSTISTSTTTTG